VNSNVSQFFKKDYKMNCDIEVEYSNKVYQIEKLLDGFDKRKIKWDRFLDKNHITYEVAKVFKKYFSNYEHYKKYFIKYHILDEFIETEPKIYWDMFTPEFNRMSDQTINLIYSKGLLDIPAKYTYMQKHFNTAPKFMDYIYLLECDDSPELIDYIFKMIDSNVFYEPHSSIEYMIVRNIFINIFLDKIYSPKITNRMIKMSVNVLSVNKICDFRFRLYLYDHGYYRFTRDLTINDIYEDLYNSIKYEFWHYVEIDKMLNTYSERKRFIDLCLALPHTTKFKFILGYFNKSALLRSISKVSELMNRKVK